MAPQQVEIAETIAALKRTLRREKEPPSDQPIHSATNRGNKLKRGANHVHAGALPYAYGADGYKQKVEHAGYTRYILERNPKRYNEYGDELDDSESDPEADADAEDENAYSGVRLEELLCPLKHPSKLATHPTLSQPFLDRALPDMVKSTEEKLRQERANLWRAKSLNRQFLGDEPWVSCGSVETNEDWDMFEPKSAKATAPQVSKKRKRDADLDMAVNGVNGHDHSDATDAGSIPVFQEVAAQETAPEGGPKEDAGQEDVDNSSKPSREAAGDVDMKDVEAPTTNGVHVKKDPQDPEANSSTGRLDVNDDTDHAEADGQDEDHHANGSASSNTTPPPPTRRITRALAAERHSSTAPTPPLSPMSTTTNATTPTVSSIPSSLLQADPLFLLPPSLTPSHRIPRKVAQLGIPVDEFLETRRLLTMYIQKQEESVRGYEAVLGKLIKAKRMRDNVWHWCKAEGHVGEWSDGEDWIDAEAWGVAPEELKKGKDEEDIEGQEEVGRKGKRRRGRE